MDALNTDRRNLDSSEAIQRPSLLEQLRSCSRAEHQQLDAQPLVQELMRRFTRESYRKFFLFSGAFTFSYQKVILASQEKLGDLFPVNPAAELWRLDAEAFGFSGSLPLWSLQDFFGLASLEQPDDVPLTLHALAYVWEGSALGSQQIAKMANKFPEALPLAYFSRSQSEPDRWGRFCNYLSGLNLSPPQQARVADAARDVFAYLTLRCQGSWDL